MHILTTISLCVLLVTGVTVVDATDDEKTSTQTVSSAPSGQPQAMIQLKFGDLIGSGKIFLTATAKQGVFTGSTVGNSILGKSTYQSSISDVISKTYPPCLYSTVSPTSANNSTCGYSLSTAGLTSSPTASVQAFQGNGRSLVPNSLGMTLAVVMQLALSS
jgi:hypothetical protein